MLDLKIREGATLILPCYLSYRACHVQHCKAMRKLNELKNATGDVLWQRGLNRVGSV